MVWGRVGHRWDMALARPLPARLLDSDAQRTCNGTPGDGSTEDYSPGGPTRSGISDPVCKYCVSIFVKYNLIYLDVSAQKYVQILTHILANRYSIHQCIYWILTCKYRILTR